MLSKAILFPEVRLFTEPLYYVFNTSSKSKRNRGPGTVHDQESRLLDKFREEPALITAVALYQNASPKSLSNLEVCAQSNQNQHLLSAVPLFYFAWKVVCLDICECKQAGTGDNIVDRGL